MVAIIVMGIYMIIICYQFIIKNGLASQGGGQRIIQNTELKGVFEKSAWCVLISRPYGGGGGM